jgi:hypothetical protein
MTTEVRSCTRRSDCRLLDGHSVLCTDANGVILPPGDEELHGALVSKLEIERLPAPSEPDRKDWLRFRLTATVTVGGESRTLENRVGVPPAPDAQAAALTVLTQWLFAILGLPIQVEVTS